jgi:N utilization substance protein A
MHIKDLSSLKESITELAESKGIDRESVISLIKEGIESAYVKTYGDNSNIEVFIDDDFNITIRKVKTVVDKVENPDLEISLKDSKSMYDEATLGDEMLIIEERQTEFKRNAIQNAKQLMVQRLREAERDTILNKFEGKDDLPITATIRRIDNEGNLLLDLEGIESSLSKSEQSPLDKYKVGNKIKVCLLDVVSKGKYPKVLISRKNAKLVRNLFNFEVPEIANGIIEIKDIVREAGMRTKISIYSDSTAIDPIGAAVGPKSSRIRAIIDELNGEKIDIIKWSDDLKEYIINAFKPADVVEVNITEENDGKVANIKVLYNQLALAIGKKGQNARLASKLVGCRINIEALGGDIESKSL